MKYLLIALLALSPVISFAETPAPDYGAEAMSQRLTAEINQNLQLQASVLSLQDQLKKLTEEVAKAKTPDAKAPEAPAKAK